MRGLERVGGGREVDEEGLGRARQVGGGRGRGVADEEEAGRFVRPGVVRLKKREGAREGPWFRRREGSVAAKDLERKGRTADGASESLSLNVRSTTSGRFLARGRVGVAAGVREKDGGRRRVGFEERGLGTLRVRLGSALK